MGKTSPITDLIVSYLNSRAKIISSPDTIIFFDKDQIIKQINNSWSWNKMSNFNKLKKAEKKLKKRNISYYYYTQDELNSINEIYKFNNGKAKFNELYFKLDDYNETRIRYYTYDNFIRYSEDYNYDFFVYLFTFFGLKSMRWSYTNAHNTETISDKNANIGVKDQKSEFQYSTNETSNKSIGIEGCKNFENNGSSFYFDSCERRAFWYSYCKKEVDDIVKEILNRSNRYSYEYYKNNESLQIRLDNRLRGAKQICYEISNNTHHKVIITKMIKISNKFASIGIKLNSTNIDTKCYTKKYSINFWDVQDMELTTLENILGNSQHYGYNIDIHRAHERYEELSNNHILSLDEQLEILQEKIRIKKLKTNRYSKRKFNINDLNDDFTNYSLRENSIKDNIDSLKDSSNSNIC